MGNWYSLNSGLQGRDVLPLVVPIALVLQFVEALPEAELPVYRLDSVQPVAVLASPHISVVCGVSTCGAVW